MHQVGLVQSSASFGQQTFDKRSIAARFPARSCTEALAYLGEQKTTRQE
jgi:hypothetical protein